MIIVGIDPALATTGYGVLEAKGTALTLIEAGLIQTSSKEKTPKRLEKIYQGILKLISDTNADCLVLEKIFSHYKHPATACILGQARGVICLACAVKKISFFEYSATRIKKAIVGKGLASKSQVQAMICNTLNLKTLPTYMDITDALALAVAHNYIARVRI